MLRDLSYSVCVAFAGFLFVWFYSEPVEQDHEAQSALCKGGSKVHLAQDTDEHNSPSCEQTDLFGFFKQAASIWTSKEEPAEAAAAPTKEFRPSIHDAQTAKIAAPDTAPAALPAAEPRQDLPVAGAATAPSTQKAGSKSDRPASNRTANQSANPSARETQSIHPRQKPDIPLFAGLGGALSDTEIERVTAVESSSAGRGSAGVDAALSYDIISRRFEAPLAGNQEQAMMPVQVTPVDLTVLGTINAISPSEVSLSNSSTNN